MFIGHSQLVKDFKNLIKAGRLAHGYIFFGEPEVGKFYFARHLANLLENGPVRDRARAGAPEGPMWRAVSSGMELAKRPLQDALILNDATGIDAMRDLKNFLWQKPIISSKRLAVINDAQNLTPQAQNAILKITEEPPGSAVIILVVNHLENLLPALVSRMQKIYFGRVKEDELKEFLKSLGRPAQNWARLAQASLGRPGRVMRLLSDQIAGKAEKYAKEFLRASGSNRSNLIKELVEEQKENPEILDRFFENLILELRRDLIKNAPVLKSILHRLFLIKSYNTNKRLQLEAI